MMAPPQYYKQTEWISIETRIGTWDLRGSLGFRLVAQGDGETWNEVVYHGEIGKRILHDRQTDHQWQTLGTMATPVSTRLKVCVLFCPHCRQAKADARWDFL